MSLTQEDTSFKQFIDLELVDNYQLTVSLHFLDLDNNTFRKTLPSNKISLTNLTNFPSKWIFHTDNKINSPTTTLSETSNYKLEDIILVDFIEQTLQKNKNTPSSLTTILTKKPRLPRNKQHIVKNIINEAIKTKNNFILNLDPSLKNRYNLSLNFSNTLKPSLLSPKENNVFSMIPIPSKNYQNSPTPIFSSKNTLPITPKNSQTNITSSKHVNNSLINNNTPQHVLKNKQINTSIINKYTTPQKILANPQNIFQTNITSSQHVNNSTKNNNTPQHVQNTQTNTSNLNKKITPQKIHSKNSNINTLIKNKQTITSSQNNINNSQIENTNKNKHTDYSQPITTNYNISSPRKFSLPSFSISNISYSN